MTEYKKNIIKREDLKNEVITKLKCNEILFPPPTPQLVGEWGGIRRDKRPCI